jgi:hypothetical protein
MASICSLTSAAKSATGTFFNSSGAFASTGIKAPNPNNNTANGKTGKRFMVIAPLKIEDCPLRER